MKRWYVVQVYAGFEEAVKSDLTKRIQDEGLQEILGQVLIPSARLKQMFETEETKDSQLFPGYVTTTERAWVAVGRTKPTVDVNGATVLKAVKEDAKWSGASLVKNIIGIAGLETGKPNLGIAITSTAGSGGHWQYFLVKGKSWVNVDNVSDTNALLLGPTDRLRFIPDHDADGEGHLTFKTWDQTTGTHGTLVDPTGSTAFGVNPGTTVLDITAINDAPVLNLSVPAILDPIPAGGTTGDGVTFASLMSATDAEGANVGIVIVATKGGSWQYRPAGGPNWLDVGKVSSGKALFLDADTEVRLANALAGPARLSFKAWDRTNFIAPGSIGPVRGTTASKQIEILTVAVGNQAPSLTVKNPVIAHAGKPVPVKSLLGVITDTAQRAQGNCSNGTDADQRDLGILHRAQRLDCLWQCFRSVGRSAEGHEPDSVCIQRFRHIDASVQGLGPDGRPGRRCWREHDSGCLGFIQRGNGYGNHHRLTCGRQRGSRPRGRKHFRVVERHAISFGAGRARHPSCPPRLGKCAEGLRRRQIHCLF